MRRTEVFALKFSDARSGETGRDSLKMKLSSKINFRFFWILQPQREKRERERCIQTIH